VRRTILGSALAALGADQLRHLELHQLRRDRLHGFADHVGVLIEQHLPDDLLDRHPVGTGRGWRLLSVEPSASPTIMSANVAGTASAQFRPTCPTPTLGT
jgi:hypothetical protein